MTENPQTNRWYLDESNLIDRGATNLPLSSAIDDMAVRKLIDSQIENTGNDETFGADEYNDLYKPGRTYIYPGIEDTNINKNLIKEVSARTPSFDVGIEEVNVDSEDTSVKTEGKNDYPKFQINNLDFGITERPKMEMDLDQKIERVKISAANGNIILDTSVEYDENGVPHLKGSYNNATYPKEPQDGSYPIGVFKTELDQEIMQYASLEITYKFIIVKYYFL